MSLDIEIHRLGLALRLAGDSQRIEPVARRLGEIAAGRLREALARIDDGGATAHEDEIVFIDHIAVQCAANTAWDDDALAAHIARHFARGLQLRLADPMLRRFRDRADFVAAALAAFADGSAARQWWFDEFDGLQPLSASAALRTLVINAGEFGVVALARLTDSALGRVLDSLHDSDARRLVVWLTARASAVLPSATIWHAAGALAAQERATPWLRVLIAAERDRPGSSGKAGWQCLRGLATLHALARRGELAMGEDERHWRGALAGALDEADWLASVSQADLKAIAADLAATAGNAAEAPATWLRSPHGGFFVLLGRLHRSGWPERWVEALRAVSSNSAAATASDSTAAAEVTLCRSLAAQVTAIALAGDTATQVLNDAVVRAACGVDAAEAVVAAHDTFACEALRALLHDREIEPLRWTQDDASSGPPSDGPSTSCTLTRLLAEAAEWLLADVAGAMPGLAGSTPAFLRAQALRMTVAIRVGAGGTPTLARLGRAPLDVLLVLAGVKRASIELPGIATIQCNPEEP